METASERVRLLRPSRHHLVQSARNECAVLLAGSPKLVGERQRIEIVARQDREALHVRLCLGDGSARLGKHADGVDRRGCCSPGRIPPQTIPGRRSSTRPFFPRRRSQPWPRPLRTARTGIYAVIGEELFRALNGARGIGLIIVEAQLDLQLLAAHADAAGIVHLLLPRSYPCRSLIPSARARP